MCRSTDGRGTENVEAHIARGITLGTKTKQSVAVEQKMMKIEMITKAASCWSRKTKDSPAPITHMMTTL